mgnify:CR=1 FL=1
MDENEMRMCPTKSEYGTLDHRVADEKAKIDLYKANTKMCSIIGLVQYISQGMALLNKTRSANFPLVLAYKFIKKAMNTHKPPDVSAMIELKLELDKIHF